MLKVERSKKERKSEYFDKFTSAVTSYNSILLVNADNVRSSQLAQVRKSLRGQAEIMMGKNTLIRKILNSLSTQQPQLEVLVSYVRGNIGFVFTNDSLSVVRDVLVENKLPAPARAGAIAQNDVIIPAGPTNMPPEKTSFFQALNIATKINRAMVELVSDVHLLKKGAKVDASQAELLNKMNILPFSYGLKVLHVYENGQVYPSSVLDITTEELVKKFLNGVAAVASVSLAIGYPTVASVPHSFINGFKNVVAIALATDITFEAAEKIKDMLNNPDAYAVAAPASNAGNEASNNVEDPEPEKKEESDIDVGVGLFGDDDEDW